MKISDFAKSLIHASEKAANIARLIRSDKALLELLVEEKTGDQKNKKFLHDFKTLGDVLIQETIRHDLGKQFPEVAENVHGEESNKFTNTLGECIVVEVKPTQQETSQLLVKVLNGHQAAADALAKEVHSQVVMDIDKRVEDVKVELPTGNVGIWIDPIDSTGQYIKGYDDMAPMDGTQIYLQGLQCVTVLIGAFDVSTGLPIIGVVNQPFYEQTNGTKEWHGKLEWGIALEDTHISSISLSSISTIEKLPFLSSKNESKELKNLLSKSRNVVEPSGAGYKLLCVCHGLASAYILTMTSIFKWDTCGPHAILLSLGGGMVRTDKLKEVLDSSLGNDGDLDDLKTRLEGIQVRYHKSDLETSVGCDQWVNCGGIVGYFDTSILWDVVTALKM